MANSKLLPQGFGQIVGTLASTGTPEVIDFDGTVTTDGVNCINDSGRLQVKKAGKWAIDVQAKSHASPASGFVFYILRLLVNGIAVGVPSSLYVNAFQEYSGAGGVENTLFSHSGECHFIADLEVDDIINAEAEDDGTANSNGADIDFIVTATYLGA